MLLETTENCSAVKIILEQVNLALVGQVIASWVEVIDVHSWHCDVVQICIQALFSCKFTTVREMVVELGVAQ